MFKRFYDFILLILAFFVLPKLLWKKYRRNLKERLGWRLPDFPLPPNGKRVWVHAVSVGETRAVIPLVNLIQKEVPDAVIFFSSTTETGQSEAKRNLPHLAGYFLLPFDFSWTMEALTKKLKPDVLILVEGDFWYNLVSNVQKVVLVNGKISEKSMKRFRLASFFTKRLFSHFKAFCVQSQRYAIRFEDIGIPPEKIVVTGNLKFDVPFPHIDKEKWKSDLGISPQDQVITIGSTHEGEEKEILLALEPLWDEFHHLKVILVPRHPDRFDRVAKLLQDMGLRFCRFSHLSHRTGNEKVILIDVMGILNPCYRLSDLAIVAGSFATHVGGHNIFEPVSLSVPTLFGPHMESQHDLVDIVLQAGAGKQVTLGQLTQTTAEMLRHPPLEMKKAGQKLAEEVHGSTVRTWAAIKSLF
jgi:3-deoxy-D-manno-octulosonic-acid transferase